MVFPPASKSPFPRTEIRPSVFTSARRSAITHSCPGGWMPRTMLRFTTVAVAAAPCPADTGMTPIPPLNFTSASSAETRWTAATHTTTAKAKIVFLMADPHFVARDRNGRTGADPSPPGTARSRGRGSEPAAEDSLGADGGALRRVSRRVAEARRDVVGEGRSEPEEEVGHRVEEDRYEQLERDRAQARVVAGRRGGELLPGEGDRDLRQERRPRREPQVVRRRRRDAVGADGGAAIALGYGPPDERRGSSERDVVRDEPEERRTERDRGHGSKVRRDRAVGEAQRPERDDLPLLAEARLLAQGGSASRGEDDDRREGPHAVNGSRPAPPPCRPLPAAGPPDREPSRARDRAGAEERCGPPRAKKRSGRARSSRRRRSTRAPG